MSLAEPDDTGVPSPNRYVRNAEPPSEVFLVLSPKAPTRRDFAARTPACCTLGLGISMFTPPKLHYTV